MILRAKWWVIEIRFVRPLGRREVRRFSTYLGKLACKISVVGTDGAVWDPWYNAYPGEQDAMELLRAVKRLNVPARIRAAPYGYRCPGASCSAADSVEEHQCALGHFDAAPPQFTDSDWTYIDFKATRRRGGEGTIEEGIVDLSLITGYRGGVPAWSRQGGTRQGGTKSRQRDRRARRRETHD